MTNTATSKPKNYLKFLSWGICSVTLYLLVQRIFLGELPDFLFSNYTHFALENMILTMFLPPLFVGGAVIVFTFQSDCIVKIGTFRPSIFFPCFTNEARVRTHNQNMTVAARAIAERNTVGDLS